MTSLFATVPGGERRVSGERGSIYIEALLAVAIMAVALIPIFSSFGLGPASEEQAARQIAALNIARAKLESLHTLSQEEWTYLADTSAPDTADPAYTVSLKVTEPDPKLELKDVIVTVSWSDHRGRPESVQLTTSVARRGG